jgi:hypothetical protein
MEGLIALLAVRIVGAVRRDHGCAGRRSTSEKAVGAPLSLSIEKEILAKTEPYGRSAVPGYEQTSGSSNKTLKAASVPDHSLNPA